MANMLTLVFGVGGALILVALFVRREWIFAAAEDAYSWLRGNRTVLFALAMALVAVPTFAALFPGLINRTNRIWRILVMLAWLAVASLATIASQGRERAVHSMTRASHRILLRQHLDDLLGPDSGIPEEYRATVYLADVDAGLLLPWYPHLIRDPGHPSVFKFGCGATGYAFRDGEPVVVVGDAVSTPEYGLSPSQQEFFADGAVVAAVPIRGADGAPVGTLCVFSTTNDGFFATEDDRIRIRRAGVRVLLQVADKIGEALSEGMIGDFDANDRSGYGDGERGDDHRP